MIIDKRGIYFLEGNSVAKGEFTVNIRKRNIARMRMWFARIKFKSGKEESFWAFTREGLIRILNKLLFDKIDMDNSF